MFSGIRSLLMNESVPVIGKKIVTNKIVNWNYLTMGRSSYCTVLDQGKVDEMVSMCKKHSLFPWSATNHVNPLPIEKCEGVYLIEPRGKKHLDFSSSLVCTNIGHRHPKVVEAIKNQIDQLTYAPPNTATEPKAELSKLLSKIVPGDINTFYYTTGGAEAVEKAIDAARQYTGKQKIIGTSRGYHGATSLTRGLVMDKRFDENDPKSASILNVLSPVPDKGSFGNTDLEICSNYCTYIQRIIDGEKSGNIAAMIIESVLGTNGVMMHPKGLLESLKDMLDKNGILLICDEVMSGFGRTGKFFGFEHSNITPDIITMAKGLNSAILPLGAIGVNDKIADYFRENPFKTGSTYNSHPVALASAIANIEVLVEEDLVKNAKKLGDYVNLQMEFIKKKHSSVSTIRNVGLFGAIELHEPVMKTIPVLTFLGDFFRNKGLYLFMKDNRLIVAPPLIITQEELRSGFNIIDEGLSVAGKLFYRRQ